MIDRACEASLLGLLNRSVRLIPEFKPIILTKKLFFGNGLTRPIWPKLKFSESASRRGLFARIGGVCQKNGPGPKRYSLDSGESGQEFFAATLSLMKLGREPACRRADPRQPICRLSKRCHLWHSDCIFAMTSALKGDVFAVLDPETTF